MENSFKSRTITKESFLSSKSSNGAHDKRRIQTKLKEISKIYGDNFGIHSMDEAIFWIGNIFIVTKAYNVYNHIKYVAVFIIN